MIEIDFTPEQERTLIKEIFENFPEAAVCLKCTKWNYKDFIFEFYDEEEDKTHVIKYEDAQRGLRTYLKILLLGNTALEGNPSHWDAIVYDAIVQCAIFGDIIYG